MAAYKGDSDTAVERRSGAAMPTSTAWPLLAALIALLVCFASAGWSWRLPPLPAAADAPWWRWWLKPYEQNAFARLPYVGVDIHGAYAAPDNGHAVVVGGNGLILLSDDGGDSWRAVTDIEWNAAAAPRSNRSGAASAAMLPLFAQAHAASAPDLSGDEISEIQGLLLKLGYLQDKPSGYADAATQQAVRDFQRANNMPADGELSPLLLKQLYEGKPRPQYSGEAQTSKQAFPVKQQSQQQSQIPALQNQQPVSPSTAPTDEEIIVPSPVDGPVDLHAVAFTDGLTGVAVGDRGVILLTNDGGYSWSVRASGSDRNLNAVTIVDAATMIAVGDGGAVVISSDAGASWQLQPAPVVVDLRAITVAGNGVVMVVGDSGCVLRSTDSGARWDQRQWLNQQRALYAIATAGQTVVAVGAQGSVLRSGDGGTNWREIDTDVDAALTAVAVDDAAHFIAAGEAGRWLQSNDDGATWQVRDAVVRTTLRQLLPQDGGIVAVGDGGTVVALEGDVVVPKVRGAGQQLHAAIALKTALLVAGGGGTLLHSTDLGRHWAALNGAAGKSLRALARIDNTTAIAVGEAGAILRTGDGGASWEDIASAASQPLLAIAASGTGTVLAGGAAGTLLRSDDQGRSWRAVDGGTDQALVALGFANPATAMAATDRGLLLRSIDGGISWRTVDISTGAIAQFAFADIRNGIAVGAAGTVLRTSNGGKSWVPINSGVDADLSDVLFIDALHVLAAGSDGVMIASDDGGSSWQLLSAWRSVSVKPVAALVSPDAATVVVTTRDGSIFYATLPDGRFDDLMFQRANYRRYPAPASLLPLLISLVFAARWRRARQASNGNSGAGVADVLVTDRPLAPGDPDYMDFGRRAAQLSRFLRHERTELPVTLAISAEWGRGKSSLMNLLSDDLAQHGYRPVWFNAWHHQKEGHLLASLLRSIQKQALPHVLTPAGFFMRVQILSHRGAWYLTAAAFPVVILLALISYFGAYPERLAAVAPNVRYLLNIEQPVTITAQTMADLEKIASSDGRSPMLKYWLPVLAGFRDARHVFVDTDELVTAMRSRAHPSAPALSSELITTVTTAAEHIRPVQRVFPELGNVWTGISAVIAALVGAVTLVLNGMSVFGLRMPRGANDSIEKTGTRERFAADFSRLTHVLGKRLVIMIDDLDRCSRQNLIDMLEHINFLASEGQCAMVVAIAYERVVKNLAVSLAEDAGRSVDNGPTETDLAEAHFYLHKLIQLMVTIRAPRKNESQMMLTGRHGKVPRRSRKLWKRSIVTLWRHVQPWVIILLLAYMGVLAGSRGLALLSPQPTLPLLQQRLSAVKTQEAAVTPAVEVTAAAPAVSASEPDDAAIMFRDAEPVLFPWWLLYTAAGVLLMLALALFLYREPQLRQMLTDRVRSALAVPVRERDSSLFAEALNLWHGVVADHLQSPRALKRFLNRLRFLAMGVVSSQQSNDSSEAHVVALAAIGIDNVDLEYNKLSPAQRALLDQHIAVFGRAPNDEERQLYLELVGEMDRYALVSPG